jgi:hypothetical protein
VVCCAVCALGVPALHARIKRRPDLVIQQVIHTQGALFLVLNIIPVSGLHERRLWCSRKLRSGEIAGTPAFEYIFGLALDPPPHRARVTFSVCSS